MSLTFQVAHGAHVGVGVELGGGNLGDRGYEPLALSARRATLQVDGRGLAQGTALVRSFTRRWQLGTNGETYPLLMPRQVINTARLQIESAEPRHLDSMRVAIESSLPELGQWMPWAIDDSRERTGEFLEDAGRAWQDGTAYRFAIALQGEIIGAVGLEPYYQLTASAELGYWLATPHTGQGLATEAASAVIGFGLEELALHRIWLHAGTENIASQRVAEKVGFRRMGRVREASRGMDGFYDCYVYDLLVTDPRST